MHQNGHSARRTLAALGFCGSYESPRSQHECAKPKRESARRNSRSDHCAYHGALLRSAAVPQANSGRVTSNHLVRFRSTSPRKNLPPSISRKRAEANFLCSFERVFVAGHCQTKQITWRDFALQGYGIPDLITFAWSTQQNQATVLSLEALRQKLQRQQFSLLLLNSNCATGAKALYRHTDTGTSATAQSLSFPEMLPRGPLSVWNFLHR